MPVVQCLTLSFASMLAKLVVNCNMLCVCGCLAGRVALDALSGTKSTEKLFSVCAVYFNYRHVFVQIHYNLLFSLPHCISGFDWILNWILSKTNCSSLSLLLLFSFHFEFQSNSLFTHIAHHSLGRPVTQSK